MGTLRQTGGAAVAWLSTVAACGAPAAAPPEAPRAQARADAAPASADAAACDASDGAACERIADASVLAARAAGLGIFAVGSKADRTLLDRVCNERGVSGACVALARIL